MKKLTFFTLIFLASFSFKSYSTTWTITVQNFNFSPANLPGVAVGDTIKWQWVNGDHTTTSETIPAGATNWNIGLNASNQTFSYVVTEPGSYHYICIPHAPGMSGDFTANVIGITPIGSEIPEKFNLEQNYPNPFNPVTNINFDVPKTAFVKLAVLNLLGQQVEILVNGQLNAGRYKADWNAADFPSGTYFYKFESDGYVNTKRMILIK